MARQVITLTTDYGLEDHFVGVIKGVILNVNPEVQLVDLSHNVNSFDVLDGALTVGLNYNFFPRGSIHLVVVDPGVGSARRAIVAQTADHWFVAPDNGVLSVVYDREPSIQIREITTESYWLQPVSSTFHGRDIFAPVAAWLSRGAPAEEFGRLIDNAVRITRPRPRRVNNRVLAAVMRVDRFGNLLTPVTPQDLPELAAKDPRFKLVINGREVTELVRSFAEGSSRQPFAYWGSSGFLEIAVNRGSAASMLGASRGTTLEVVISDGGRP